MHLSRKWPENLQLCWYWASLIAQLVKNLPAMQETWVRFLGWEDPLEKEMATHSSILAWRIPWTEEPGGLRSIGLQESDMTEQLNHQTMLILEIYIYTYTYTYIPLNIRFNLGLITEELHFFPKERSTIFSLFFLFSCFPKKTPTVLHCITLKRQIVHSQQTTSDKFFFTLRWAV